jgi:hypothetical protein
MLNLASTTQYLLSPPSSSSSVGRRRSPTADEDRSRCRRPSFSPPHRRRVGTVRPRPRYLARWVDRVPLVLTPSATPPRNPGQASSSRAAVLVPGAVIAPWASRAVSSAWVPWATSPVRPSRACKPVGQKWPDTILVFLNIFKNFRNSFKLLKFIRICTKFRKNTK